MRQFASLTLETATTCLQQDGQCDCIILSATTSACQRDLQVPAVNLQALLALQGAVSQAARKVNEAASKAYATAAATADKAGATKDEAAAKAYDAAVAAAEKAGATKDEVVSAAQSAASRAKQYAAETLESGKQVPFAQLLSLCVLAHVFSPPAHALQVFLRPACSIRPGLRVWEHVQLVSADMSLGCAEAHLGLLAFAN